MMGLRHFLRGTTPEGEVYAHLVRLHTELQTAMAILQTEYPELQPEVAANALRIVANVPMSIQSVDILVQRMHESQSDPPRYLWNSISSAFLLAFVVYLDAGCKYGERITKNPAFSTQLARIEGLMLGWIERQGWKAWPPSYTCHDGPYSQGSPIVAFEKARNYCSEGTRRHMVDS